LFKLRAPGQRAEVILHGRRFAEPTYANLLRPEFQLAERISSDAELLAWHLSPKEFANP